MITFEIGLESSIPKETILSVLRDWFPALSLGESDELIAEGRPWTEIVIHVMDHPSEFRTKIVFYVFPGSEDDPVFYSIVREVARRFSEHFGCRSICEAVGWGDPEGYPGTAIVWDAGRAFLADDYGTDYGDGEGGPVRIRKPIHVDSGRDRSVLTRAVGPRVEPGS